MLADIDHVQLAMPKGEEQAARSFYGDALGLKEIEKPESLRARGGVWFVLGARQVHLGVEANFTPATKAHPAFLVHDLDRLRERLTAAGFPVIEDKSRPRLRAVLFQGSVRQPGGVSAVSLIERPGISESTQARFVKEQR